VNAFLHRSASALLPAWLFIIGFMGVASPSPARHDVAIRFDPESGEIRISVTVAEATAPLTLDPDAWISFDELRIGADAVEDVDLPLALSADELAGREISFALSGQLPSAPEEPGRVGAFAGGAYLFGGDGWLPHSAEASAVYSVTLELPDSHRAIATGTLESERVGNGTYAATFRFEGGSDDLAVFFGPYVISETFLGDVRLRTYFPERHAGEADAYLDAVGTYLSQYTEQIGDYPHASFSVVSAPIPVGYGLDSMTYVSEHILAHPYMRGRSLAHEVLHSWWGSGVRIDFDSGNWGEGLTTYQADYALAVQAGPEAALEMRREWLQRLSVLPDALDEPARAFRSAGHGAGQTVGYSKVAMIFHMLRNELGADVFQTGIRAFWDANRGRTADWHDLQAAFETASGGDLGWFFEQWLDRSGLPTLTIDAVSTTQSATGHAVHLAVAQSGPVYRLTVPVSIETQSGVERQVVRLDESEGRASIEVATRPVAVQIDPRFDIARRLPRGEVPPSFREALWTANEIVLVTAGDGYADAAAAINGRLAPDARIVAEASPGGGAGAVLVIGATADVIARRSANFERAAPAIATAGASRAWVERDGRQRLWLFMSAEEPDSLGTLHALKYYGALGYAAFEEGRASETGSWPTAGNPLRVELE